MRRPNLPKGRPGVPRRHVRIVTAPTASFSPFKVVAPIMQVMSLFGDSDDSVRAQIDRGRLIGMAEQQIRTAERENAQGNFASGMILNPDRNQYI